MKAAVVGDFGHPPRYGDFGSPDIQPDEVAVNVRAAALSQLVRAQAAGRHYSAAAGLPFVPGADGIGVCDDGRRVYFAFPRRPFGAMAERSAVRSTFCADVPPDLDDVTAAAMGNPGMSSWAALTLRAKLQRGEAVLVNGATGASGRLAIQIARHLGAGRVVATGRDESSEGDLRALGADEFVPLNQSHDALVDAVRRELTGAGIDIVLDYLWGPPASAIIAACVGKGSGAAERRVRFIQIGTVAGDPVALHGGSLRSSGLELLGTGLGSVSHAALIGATGDMLKVASQAGFKVAAAAIPLSDVESAWGRDTNERIVFTMPGVRT
jgi:NADPH:quinone reductase-like Zn-dependent oxidoreductase